MFEQKTGVDVPALDEVEKNFTESSSLLIEQRAVITAPVLEDIRV